MVTVLVFVGFAAFAVGLFRVLDHADRTSYREPYQPPAVAPAPYLPGCSGVSCADRRHIDIEQVRAMRRAIEEEDRLRTLRGADAEERGEEAVTLIENVREWLNEGR